MNSQLSRASCDVANTGLEITIEIWVSIWKTRLRIWISTAVSGFPVRKPNLRLPKAVQFLGFLSETLLQELGFCHHFWVSGAA